MSCEHHDNHNAAADLHDQAADVFVRRMHDDWSSEDQQRFESRLRAEPEFAHVVQGIGETWNVVQPHAISPELLALREQAIARARRSSAHRWRARRFRGLGARSVAAAAVLVMAVIGIQMSPYGYRSGTHETQIGELRILELDDHSQVALDAGTRIRVRFSGEARTVELLAGQAQFSVTADPQRPFKVQAGDRVIVALGTVFNVEYVGREVRVVTLEGRVAVVNARSAQARADRAPRPGNDAGPGPVIELSAGEAVQAVQNGPITMIRDGDLAAAAGWREGKLIFRDTPLSQAVERLNRYSRHRLEIADESLESMSISGVFAAGDTWAFAEAVQVSLPVKIEQPRKEVIRLARR